MRPRHAWPVLQRVPKVARPSTPPPRWELPVWTALAPGKGRGLKAGTALPFLRLKQEGLPRRRSRPHHPPLTGRHGRYRDGATGRDATRQYPPARWGQPAAALQTVPLTEDLKRESVKRRAKLVAILSTAALSVAATPLVATSGAGAVGEYLLKLGPLGALVWLTSVFLSSMQRDREAFMDFLAEERAGRGAVMDSMRRSIDRNTEALMQLGAPIQLDEARSE